MKWFVRIGIAFGVLLLILIALPFFITLNDYIPEIERAVSDRLKEPVSITSIKFAPFPLPHLTVDGITVGKTGDIKVSKVTITPDFFTLLSSTKVIRSVEIKSLVLTQKALDKIPEWMKSDDKSPQQPTLVRVESIR